jgi:chorismate mutase/prephenate dehydratase
MKIDKLRQFRQKIDTIDQNILKLLNKRADIVINIGKLKEKDNIDFWDPKREKEIFAQLKTLNKGPLPNEAILNIFHEIVTATRHIEHPVKVTFLGPEATFSHIAAIKHFGKTTIFYPAPTIKDVFWEVEKGHYDYGVVPVENSIEGTVAYTLDMFMQSELKVCGEIYLKINHYLASSDRKKANIERIYAHPQATAQCRNWLFYNYPHLPIEEVESTALAAQKAKENPKTAAITTKLAAEKCSLYILDKHIEDFAHNTTRFWVIGQSISNPTGKDKTSLIFATPDKPGALYDALKPFAQHRINLTKLESRPMKNLPWHYMFFVDLDGHCTEKLTKEALEELKKICAYFKLLGSYPKQYGDK